jgi:hypothetical protein
MENDHYLADRLFYPHLFAVSFNSTCMGFAWMNEKEAVNAVDMLAKAIFRK